MEVNPQITGVTLLPEGIEIGYINVPQDLRKNGLMWSRTVFIPHGSDYEDEIEAFMEALRALLTDALDDEDRVEPIEELEEEEDDDDDE